MPIIENKKLKKELEVNENVVKAMKENGELKDWNVKGEKKDK